MLPENAELETETYVMHHCACGRHKNQQDAWHTCWLLISMNHARSWNLPARHNSQLTHNVTLAVSVSQSVR